MTDIIKRLIYKLFTAASRHERKISCVNAGSEESTRIFKSSFFEIDDLFSLSDDLFSLSAKCLVIQKMQIKKKKQIVGVLC